MHNNKQQEDYQHLDSLLIGEVKWQE